jgi:hypothetical protein
MVKDQLAELLVPMLDAIDAALPAEEVVAAAPILDPTEFRRLVERLAGLIATADVAAGDELVAHEAMLRAGLKDRFDTVQKALRNFDFDLAARELGQATVPGPTSSAT